MSRHSHPSSRSRFSFPGTVRRVRFVAISFALSACLSACNATGADKDDGGGEGGGLPVVADSALNGIYFKLEGKEYALGNVSVNRFSPANRRELNTSYAGTAMFHGTRLNYAALTVSRTLGADSVQACGSLDTQAAMRLEFGSVGDWGGSYTATACEIKLDYMSQSGGIQGRIVSATLKNASGKTIQLSGGGFRVYSHQGWPGEAPAVTPVTPYLATLQIDSGSFELPAGQHFRLAKPIVIASGFGLGTRTEDGNAQVDGNASDAIVFGVTGTPATGACGPNLDLRVTLGAYQSEMIYRAANTGGACTMTVDGQGSGAVLAEYTATLVANDDILPAGKRTIRVRGMFRNYSLGVPLAAAQETLHADSLGLSFATGADGSWHFPANAAYRVAASGAPFKPGGTPSFSASFQRGRDTRSYLSVTLQYVPAATGTYACGDVVPGTNASQGYRTRIVASVSDTAHAGISYRALGAAAGGGACTINVTRYDAARIEGTYNATFVAAGAGNLLPDGDTTLVVSGSFRMQGLP